MRITVKIKPNSRKPEIRKIDDANFLVAVKEPPTEGRANRALVKNLAEYFNIKPSALRIASGHTYKKKVIEISP